MKHIKIVLAALALVALPSLLWAGFANAQRFGATVGRDEVVDSSIYSVGRDVSIEGTIKGDVFCAGQNVHINAKVEGDVICAAQTLTIKGDVRGNVRAAAQVLTVDAAIERNMTVMAQTFSFDAMATIGGDVTVMADSSNMKGSVGRDVLINGNSVIFNGAVERNVTAHAYDIELRDDTHVGGNFMYTSDKQAIVASGAHVAGNMTQEIPKSSDGKGMFAIGWGMYLYFLAAGLLLTLIVALILPQPLRTTGDLVRKRFGMVLLTGFVAAFAIPIIAFALALTFVGLPLALLVLMIWALLAAASGPVVAYFLGKLLLGRVKNIVLVALFGSVLLTSLHFVPILGFIVFVLAYWLGSGAVLMMLSKSMPKPKYQAK